MNTEPRQRSNFRYVSSPYSHENDGERQLRYELVSHFVAKRQKEDFKKSIYFSPIQYWHYPAVDTNLPTDAAYWWSVNKSYIDVSTALIILKLPGWENSKGMKQEIEYARDIGILIYNEKLRSLNLRTVQELLDSMLV